jgi:DnaK suppressor protein
MATAKKAATAVKKTPAKALAKKAPTKAPAKAATKGPAKKAAPAPAKPPVAAKAPVAKKIAPTKAPAPVKAAAAPKRQKKVVLDKWQLKQKELLLSEKSEYLEQARLLQDEADELMRGAEPGDVQFDDESGEGGTLAIDRERDLALALQALSITEEIDDALRKLERGTYGTCESCGQNIIKARLEALPYARQCIACKTGGLSRR